MTAINMAAMIGQKAMLRIEGFRVAVDILDAKNAYGNVRYLVRPVEGDGEAWVDSARVYPVEEKA